MNKRPYDHKRESAVIIDHLSFSVPLVEFRNLENAGGRMKTKWAKLPKRTWSKIKDNSVREQLMSDWQAEYEHVMYERFKQFASEILNVRISASRDRGFQGYTNSAKILAKNAPVELGFVGFGGNNNTLYVQLSGQGCNHVFSHTQPFALHGWLANTLSIKKLNRIDIAYDDFDGNYSIEYAELAYRDEAFKNPNGGQMPKCTTILQKQGNKVTGHTFAVGSRQSNTYWRIYDKALEQGSPEGTVWFRSEVELKRVNSAVLASPAKAFAGINRFSSSVNLEFGISYKSLVKQVTLDFNARILWAKRQCGRTISDVLESFGGDVYAALGALCDDRGGKFCLPDTQALILNHHLLEVERNVT